MKTIIEFLYDPQLQTQPVLDLIHQIEANAESDPGMMQLYKFIIRGLEFLERHGIPHVIHHYFTGIREDGRPYTIKMVKQLRNHVPLMEFRVNWEGTGAFRAVFFEYQHEGKQILIFPRAVVKQSTYDPDFERIAREAEAIYHDFMTDQEKYITFFGGVEDVPSQ
ncbi:hypothetical protein P4H32_31905 [Bacillus cereus]|nr:hypothetical protein [Bacillus cereus]